MTDMTDFNGLGTVAGLMPLTRYVRGLSGARGCFFTFHRAASPERWAGLPNRPFWIDTSVLDRMLAFFARTGWAVVTLDEALARTARDLPGDRFVNLSIDDCYRDTAEDLVPVFRRHGVPVTLFVTTGIPDGTLALWAAGLEQALVDRDRIRLDGDTIDVTGTAAKRQAFTRIARAWDGPEAARHYAAFCTANGIDAATMHERHAISWDMLKDLAGDPLVEIGSHTVSHARISALDEAGATAELAGSRQRLEEMLGIPIRHFAFPYGRSGDCGPRDFTIARAAGYASAATTRKGLARAGQDPFELPRNTINGEHRSLLFTRLHLLGLTGLAARVTYRV